MALGNVVYFESAEKADANEAVENAESAETKGNGAEHEKT